MAKFLKKSQELYFGAILGAFPQIWAKNEFSRKKDFASFSIFELSTIVPKIRKT